MQAETTISRIFARYSGDRFDDAWLQPNRRGSDRKTAPEGWNRKVRGENPGTEGQAEASTLKGLKSLRAADTDGPGRRSSGCQCPNHWNEELHIARSKAKMMALEVMR
jgi:hypothetical protein